jgi:hypothetical protein
MFDQPLGRDAIAWCSGHFKVRAFSFSSALQLNCNSRQDCKGSANSRGDESSTLVLAHSTDRSVARLLVWMRPGQTKAPPHSFYRASPPLRAPCGHSPRTRCQTQCAHRPPPDSRGSDHRPSQFAGHKPVARPLVEEQKKLPALRSMLSLTLPPIRIQRQIPVSTDAPVRDPSCPCSAERCF